MNLDKIAIHWLAASYIYYHLKRVSPVSDSVFDKWTKDLAASDNWTMHRDLITNERLKAFSAFDIIKEDYPSQNVRLAYDWANGDYTYGE